MGVILAARGVGVKRGKGKKRPAEDGRDGGPGRLFTPLRHPQPASRVLYKQGQCLKSSGSAAGPSEYANLRNGSPSRTPSRGTSARIDVGKCRQVITRLTKRGVAITKMPALPSNPRKDLEVPRLGRS